MRTTTTKNTSGSKGDNKATSPVFNRLKEEINDSRSDNPISQLTEQEGLWLDQLRPECCAFIRHQDDKISWEDSAEIFAGQVEKLHERGFQSLYSQKTREAMSQGLILGDGDKLAILKNRLRKRVKDHFRSLRRQKAGHIPPACECGKQRCKCESRDPGFSRIVEISDYHWNQIPDQRIELESERNEARDRLSEVKSKVWEHLNPKDRAILGAAIRCPEGLLYCGSLFDAMSDEERILFRGRSSTKVAIAARTQGVCRKIRRILRTLGKPEFFDA